MSAAAPPPYRVEIFTAIESRRVEILDRDGAYVLVFRNASERDEETAKLIVLAVNYFDRIVHGHGSKGS